MVLSEKILQNFSIVVMGMKNTNIRLSSRKTFIYLKRNKCRKLHIIIITKKYILLLDVTFG